MLLRYLRSSFLVWFGLIFTVVGLVVFAAAVYVAGKTAIRRGPFYPVTATAVGRRVFQHLSGGDSYYIEFRYAARDGLSRRGSASVSKNDYLSSKTGDQIPVSVSEAHPDEVWP